MIGTIVNVAAVLVGSGVGIFLHSRLPERVTKITFQAIGVFTMYLGFSKAAESHSLLVLIFSIVAGSVCGEFIDLDSHFRRLSDHLTKRANTGNTKVTDGMVAAFLLFCMGPMTIMGAFEEGLGGTPNLLLSKSVLDGFASVALASSLGIGVIFAAIPLLLYQGGLTLCAGALQNILTEVMVHDITAVGGLILIALGIDILGIKHVKVLNMLPALVFAAVFSWLNTYFF